MSLISPDGGILVDLVVPDAQRSEKMAEAINLPRLEITDYDLQKSL